MTLPHRTGPHRTGRPNILILMVDQLNGTLFQDGPAAFLHAPHLKALAQRSARFANNYTDSPLCAPGRASFMSGQLPSRTRVYDNAAEFASDIPTYAHHLRAAGYHNNHVHPRGWISSAFYVDLPDDIAAASNHDGCLAFGEPGIATTPPLSAQHVIRPAPGMLVLFPSYFWHGTVPFTSDQTRLTVAFDVLPDIHRERA